MKKLPTNSSLEKTIWLLAKSKEGCLVAEAKMQSPPPPTIRSAAASTATTYTTIPISGNEVISRSFHNLSAFLSLRRPWAEFMAVGVFDRPESISGAEVRLRKNAHYFRINYGLLVIGCGLLSLVGTPLSFLVIGVIFALWLILYFFREDPLFLWNHFVSDRMILVGLISLSVVGFLFTGTVETLFFGLGIGLVISAVHGVLRNPDGLFLDESEAISIGLMGSVPNSDRRNVMR